MGAIARYTQPRDFGGLVAAVRAFVLIDLGLEIDADYRLDEETIPHHRLSIDACGSRIDIVDGDGTALVLTGEEAELVESLRLDGGSGDLEHLRAWRRAGRPSLEAIAELKGLGPITQVEAAAIRTMRAGEAIEGMNFTPDEIARMKRSIFADVLARGVDAHLGETEPADAPKPARRRKGAARA